MLLLIHHQSKRRIIHTSLLCPYNPVSMTTRISSIRPVRGMICELSVNSRAEPPFILRLSFIHPVIHTHTATHTGAHARMRMYTHAHTHTKHRIRVKGSDCPLFLCSRTLHLMVWSHLISPSLHQHPAPHLTLLGPSATTTFHQNLSPALILNLLNRLMSFGYLVQSIFSDFFCSMNMNAFSDSRRWRRATTTILTCITRDHTLKTALLHYF